MWTKPAKKERLSHVIHAARFLDEVDMEVDENIISAGKLAESESSRAQAADKEEDHFSWEDNVQNHVKALRNRARQFEAGCMTNCDDLMWVRKNLWNSTRAECGREPSERKTRKSQTLPTASWVDQVLHGRRCGVHWVLLHYVGDSAKDSCGHTVLLDTSDFNGHDSRGRIRRLTPEDELCCWFRASWDIGFFRRTLQCALVWTRALCPDYTVAGRKILKRASMSFPSGQTRLRFRKACQLLSRTCILTPVSSSMLRRLRLIAIGNRYSEMVRLQASNLQELHHLSIHKCVVASWLMKVCTFLTTLIPPLVPPTDSDESLRDAYAGITAVKKIVDLHFTLTDQTNKKCAS